MMEEEHGKKVSGCGLSVLYNSFFRRGTADPNLSPLQSSSAPQSTRASPVDPKRRRSTFDEEFMLESTNAPNVRATPAPSMPKAAASGGGYVKASGRPAPGGRKPGPLGLSGELDSLIHDHQRSKGSSTLVRASSGNVMVFGNLGNIRAPGATTPNRNVLDYLPKTSKEKDGEKEATRDRPRPNAGSMAPPSTNEEDEEEEDPQPPEVLCRALSKRLEPEELKEMGNEEYKNGRYAEAVALYDRAIVMDPHKASYWCNKAAALMAMGQLLKAVAECKEAVRIDPSYGRAHRRLATLYLRLGEAEKAIHHFKLAKREANSQDMAQAYRLQGHLSQSVEARKKRDWHSMLKEARAAVASGADADPQILGANVEALLALGKQEEAESTLDSAVKFDIDASAKFFGPSRTAYLLSVRAQVQMAAGRFDEAVAIAQKAAQLDPSSREGNAIARKTRAVASARSAGNDLFKASKVNEASVAYSEGLDHDPQNAILLCNRAACRVKLGQWEKAIEDCNAALIMRPSYAKARLRRADCNAKLERWEASVQDYEALVQQLPGDEEVGKALVEAQQQLKKPKGQDHNKFANNFTNVTSKDQFKQLITAPGEFLPSFKIIFFAFFF
ncbi:TPR repeat-containing thioredoxin TTL1-like [Zingiber officinale]|uniref:TPR repeat-containing thioredoxin TTL1-like n=1 Tax=Zingiber officinale TaxID=94328 RepID=UPI001C4B65BB|nr:TPR repeat-containing thioredoxin TTL1-like [Zingiber officinale]XP_042392190.1 TPR repeat-containing thioredoxin TTL1-like [Zingiber officinale]